MLDNIITAKGTAFAEFTIAVGDQMKMWKNDAQVVVMHYGFVKERFDNTLQIIESKGFACVELEVVEAIIITIKIRPI